MKITKLSYELASEVLSEMTVKDEEDLGSADVFAGHHSSHGDIAVCVNAAGDSFMVS